MANTYSSLYYRIIFSTKNRVKSIEPEIEKRCGRISAVSSESMA